MTSAKRLALVAHDGRKAELVSWCRAHKDVLAHHTLYTTGNTGTFLAAETGLQVTRLNRGILGGDVQIGARIVEGQIDVLIFFWDPLVPQPHDADVKALLRIAVLSNVPVACNVATADSLVTTSLRVARRRTTRPKLAIVGGRAW
jgi:methylglyoxal synthase